MGLGLNLLSRLKSDDENSYSDLLVFYRILHLRPVLFISSKLSTCVQSGYRAVHFKTVFSPKKAATHMEFMRYSTWVRDIQGHHR